MEMLYSAVVGELVSRSISFLFAKFDREPAATTMHEDLQRLRHLLLRSGAIVQDAEKRNVPSLAMLQQLKALRDETFRGYYVLDVVRCRAALGRGEDTPRDDDDGGEDDEAKEEGTMTEKSRRAFILSRFNPAKRVRFPSPSDASSSETEAAAAALGGASPVELQQVVRSLEVMVGDMKEFVMFLGTYPPFYRQPYSAHMSVDKCMFGRHMEKEMVMEFLLKNEPRGGAENLSVLPIVGPLHIGKSTLVEHVCCDERVRSHFSLILFYTGNDLKDESVATFRDKCVIKHHADNALEERLLVVIELIDDVDDETWNKLHSSQRSISIAQGRKMIITSRSEKIARFGTTQAITLKPLPVEAYWYFFKMAAFGSDDPAVHPKMASLALEIANVMRGSFMFAFIGAALLRAQFNAQSWYRVLKRSKHLLQKNISMIGEQSDYVKSMFQAQPRVGWSLLKSKPDKHFMLQDIHQRGSGQEEVPKITFFDLLAGNDEPPQGTYEILYWKSRIPPLFSYICTCEIYDM